MRTNWLRALILVVVLVGGVITPVTPVGDARATPSGFVTIPDANVHEDLPVDQSISISKEDLEGSVMVSDNASTTEIVVTTSKRAEGYLDNGSSVGGGSLALVIQDDTNHAGREVAIPADAVKGAIGRIPEAVHGTHEDGSEWTSQVRAESGLLIFEVPHFSSNTVTFSGEVSITGTYTDGSSVSYEVSSLDSVSNFTINISGKTTTEAESISNSDIGLSHSKSVSIAGNADPAGPSTNNKPEVTISSYRDPSNDGTLETSFNELAFGTYSGSKVHSEVSFTDPPTKMSELGLKLAYVGTSATVDIYIVEESPDGTAGEGTLVKDNWSPPSSSGDVVIPLDTVYETQASEITVEFVTESGDGSYQMEIGPDSKASSTRYQWIQSGSVQDSHSRWAHIWVPGGASNVQVSADDGTSKSIGDLSAGNSTTVEFPVTTSAAVMDINGSGIVDYTLDYTERVKTVDPTVEVNGNITGSSGALSDGSTVSLSTNDSWIESGANTVNVSVGDGSLSADAPDPSVSLNYRHEADDEISVNYSSDGWTERYNTSHTYASTQENATNTIPFQGSVTEISRLEVRTDGGSWGSVPSSRYSLDGSDLTVQLDDGDGDGDVDAGTEMSVRVTGRHVKAVNGAITVTDPILPGEDADVEFKIDSKSSGFYIDLSKVPDAGVRYTYQESWSNPEDHTIVDASGEKRLKLPNAPAGGSARVTFVPVTVTPETGEAKVSVADPDEPTITMGAGSSSGDDVTIRYLEASTGTTYNLYSTSRDRIVAKETADAGTVSFVEDDSAESLMINASSSGGGGGGLGFDTQAPPDYGSERPVLVMGALAALVIGLVWATGRTGIRGRQRWALVGAVSLGLGLISLESLYPGAISRRIGEGLGGIFSQLGTVVPIAGIAAVAITGYMVVSWWQSRKAEASTPDTKVTFSLGDKKK